MAGVPKEVADAVALIISRATDQYVPSSECKAVVALIAVATARHDISIFQREDALRNLRKLASDQHIENNLLGDQEEADPNKRS
jgi:hypothetical protein